MTPSSQTWSIRDRILPLKVSNESKEKGDPKNFSASERVKVYPDEQFTVIISSRKLFCCACPEELVTKKSSIEFQIKSQKHIYGRKKLALNNKNESDILQALKAVKSTQLVMVNPTQLECTE